MIRVDGKLILYGGTNMVDFGARLKKLRAQKGMTQETLAAELGVSKSVISYYEMQTRYPSPHVIKKLSAIFHVSADYLLGIEHGEMLDLSGLDEDDISAVKRMVDALRKKNEK